MNINLISLFFSKHTLHKASNSSIAYNPTLRVHKEQASSDELSGGGASDEDFPDI